MNSAAITEFIMLSDDAAHGATNHPVSIVSVLKESATIWCWQQSHTSYDVRARTQTRSTVIYKKEGRKCFI